MKQMQRAVVDAMEEAQQLKIYFIPYLAAGHMNPLSDIATLFASRGQLVTIITTHSNAHSLSSSTFLRLHTVDFPSQEVGLSHGVENLYSVNDLDTTIKIHRAAMLLREPMERFIEQNPPDCIVADFLMSWVDDVASKLHIPRLTFNGFSLFAVCAVESMKRHPLPESHSGPFLVSDLPHQITIPTTPPKQVMEFLNRVLDIGLKSHGLLVNNFLELDGEEYLQHYEKTTGGHKAWHVGPASLVRRTTQEKTERGQQSAVSEHECLSWLDTKQINSVLYICFGSVCHFPDNQLYEIACALESSGCEFIWVVPEKKGKENESEEEKEKWLPKGFEERTIGKNKGMIIRGWAPQLLILGHRAIGAFLTHCGWNSTVEAVCAGVPMITWPTQGDQFYNERLICEVRGIGVEVGAEEWRVVAFGKREKLVGRNGIEKAMRRLMDGGGGGEAQEIRRRAHEFAKKAVQSLEEGSGSSYNNMTALIDYLKQLKHSCQGIAMDTPSIVTGENSVAAEVD